MAHRQNIKNVGHQSLYKAVTYAAASAVFAFKHTNMIPEYNQTIGSKEDKGGGADRGKGVSRWLRMDSGTLSKDRRVKGERLSFQPRVSEDGVVIVSANIQSVKTFDVYGGRYIGRVTSRDPDIMKITRAIVGDYLFKVLMKGTFYGHFVAGEDTIAIRPTLERLRSFGVKPILDYSVEEDISQEEAERREVESFADRRYKVQSARTYFYLNEAQCERNLDVFQECLEKVSVYKKFNNLINLVGATYGTGICAIKMTALGRPQLLLQLSEVIMRTRQYMAEVVGGGGNVLTHHVLPEELEKKFEQAHMLKDAPVQKFLDKITYDKEGVIHLFPWSGIIDENQQLSETFRVPDLKSGRMVRLLTQLTPKEEEMFRNMIRRIDSLCKMATNLDVRIMVDAEQTYFQPAITRITLEMMRKYNQNKAVIFNTYQCYLKNAYKEATTDLEQAKRQNFFFGAKLVRGAYLEQERARAAALGYPDPTNNSFELTTEMYHQTLTECLRRIQDLKDKGEEKKIAIMVASHNEHTVRFAIEKMKEIGILPQDKVICFGQLLGMCDYITFPLGQAGYSAYKYIPYGPINEVLPYLSRRAHENKGILKKIKKEKRLLLSEIGRRITNGQIIYTPKGNYTPV
uniref:Proline dehydrogenase n=1 Tax=Timema cristinae TaxID=61476 RepID=A0A7R9GR52_TIMCR|nr:unnamed protein product [Timema cristinae]